jgi:hypothetical protein
MGEAPWPSSQEVSASVWIPRVGHHHFDARNQYMFKPWTKKGDWYSYVQAMNEERGLIPICTLNKVLFYT